MLADREWISILRLLGNLILSGRKDVAVIVIFKGFQISPLWKENSDFTNGTGSDSFVMYPSVIFLSFLSTLHLLRVWRKTLHLFHLCVPSSIA